MERQTQADTAVKERYGQAALAQEAQLCCPVDYDPQYLKIIPRKSSSATTVAVTPAAI